jgi:hypothetical protein
MPTEIIESKEIYRGFIALRLATLRLADGARVSEWRLWRRTPVLPEATLVGALSALMTHRLSGTKRLI